jgi:photosystem II stability/assembly factor-like uncharacterized protein
VGDASGNLLGIYRLDLPSQAWLQIATPPPLMPSPQADYDLAIAVDPVDATMLYVGGSYFDDNQTYPGSIWRCQVSNAGGALSMTSVSIGTQTHADVHVLTHTPGDPNSLWATCDGGIFLNRDPRNSDNFAPRNIGLACLCPTFFAQHPTDPGILLCGLQDNGTAYTSGGSVWNRVGPGDGGYCLINWADPQQVMVFADGDVYRSTSGGATFDAWQQPVEFPWATMTEPIVGTPYNPASTADAAIAAIGTGQSVFVSGDFGATWPQNASISVPTAGEVYSMRFASPARLYLGTTVGEIFRADLAGGAWNVTRLDALGPSPLPLTGVIGDVAIDWADAALNSIYVAFGGVGDYRHVWHFDGTAWEARSGLAGGACLLDVEHNALAIDRLAPTNVYVGADIGLWHSADGGATWNPLANGLPEAPVFDVQIHPTRRLLRVTTHGRGLYEYQL